MEAYEGAVGLDKAASENPDHPSLHGCDAAEVDRLCALRTLRDEGNIVPVIILTAREEEADKVWGWRSAPTISSPSPFPCGSSSHPPGWDQTIRRTAMNAAASPAPAETAMPVSGGLSINTDSHQVYGRYPLRR